MRELFKIGALLAAIFATTFVVLKLTGVLTLADIHNLFKSVSALAPAYIVMLVVLLLFTDLFIAIPTMTISILAGYFLGAPLGAFAVALGMMCAGICGYADSSAPLSLARFPMQSLPPTPHPSARYKTPCRQS